MSATPNVLLRLRYEKWAEAYYKVRPLEEFIETRRQSKQRTIMLVSFDHVHAHRPDIHHFSRILVQYPRRNEAEPGRMVADNMVVVSARPVRAEVSFDLPVQPARPFLVMETVSPHGSIKHYETTLRVCERVLRVPYYLACYPGHEDLDLFQHTGNKYESVASNAEGRYALPELELEVAIREGWARFWFRGELVRLPGEIQHELINTKTRSPRKRRGAAGAAKAADKRIPELQEAEQLFQRLLVKEGNGKKKK